MSSKWGYEGCRDSSMGQCVSCRHEDLGLIPRTHLKGPGMVVHICIWNSSPGKKTETSRSLFSLASPVELQSSRPVKDRIKRKGEQHPVQWHGELSSGLCVPHTCTTLRHLCTRACTHFEKERGEVDTHFLNQGSSEYHQVAQPACSFLQTIEYKAYLHPQPVSNHEGTVT